MAIEKVINIKVNSGNSEKEIKKIDEGLKKTNKSTSGLTATLDKFTGGAVTKLKGMTGALGGVANGFKSIGLAIAASGIGLLIVTIAAVTSAFKASEEGQNKFAKIMAIIGSVTGNLIDLLSDFGELVISAFENPKKAISDFANLIKENIVNRFEGLIELIPQLGKAIGLLFKGQFSEAGAVAANAVGKVALGVDDLTGAIGKAGEALKKFSKEFADDAAKAAQIAEKRAEADRIERGLIVERAEANRKIAELREIAARRDLYDLSQRKAALIEANKINDEIINKEIKASILRRDALIEENTLSKSNKEALKSEEEAKAAVIRLDTQRLQLSKRLGTELSALNQQELSEAQKLIEEKQKARQKEIEEFGKQNDSLELDNLRAKEEAKVDIIKQGVEARLKQAELEAETRIIFEENVAIAKEDLANNTFNLLSNLAKEGSDLAKGLAIANVVREQVQAVSGIISNTAVANAKAAAASPLTAGQPFVAINTISAALGIAGSVAGAVKSIKDINGEKKSASVGSVPSGGGGGSSAAPSFNLVQGTGSNQIAESIGGQKEPLKAYVVSSDVSSGQSLDRNIIENASIG